MKSVFAIAVACQYGPVNAADPAWKKVPTAPPPLEGSFGEGPELPQLPPLELTYDDYEKGQINLESSRLARLIDEVRFQIRGGNRQNFSVGRISIGGFADETPITRQDTIRERLPKSMEISFDVPVTNKDIALGRAISIRDTLHNEIGFQLPTDIRVDGVFGLPESPKNRRIELNLEFYLEGGLREMEKRPWQMN